jgi:hypothetical protein
LGIWEGVFGGVNGRRKWLGELGLRGDLAVCWPEAAWGISMLLGEAQGLGLVGGDDGSGERDFSGNWA